MQRKCQRIKQTAGAMARCAIRITHQGFSAIGCGKCENIIVKRGETIIIHGGPSTGKTETLLKVIRRLNERGGKTIFINAALPVSDWVKEFKLFGKNLDGRVSYLLKNLPEEFYLLIDNAEKITDSRKLELVLLLAGRAAGCIFACNNFTQLGVKLKARLQYAKVYSLGSGADTFDITYMMVAVIVIAVALMGAQNLIFLAAALRYMFQGTRMGGRKI